MGAIIMGKQSFLADMALLMHSINRFCTHFLLIILFLTIYHLQGSIVRLLTDMGRKVRCERSSLCATQRLSRQLASIQILLALPLKHLPKVFSVICRNIIGTKRNVFSKFFLISFFFVPKPFNFFIS